MSPKKKRCKASIKHVKISLFLMKRLPNFSQPKRKAWEASPCVCKKICASLTVEAALVLPLYLMALAAMLYFFRVQYVNTAISKCMYQTGQRIAEYYIGETDGEPAARAVISAMMYRSMRDFSCSEKLLENSLLLVDTEGSDVDKLQMKVSYRVKLPIRLFGLQGVRQQQSLQIKYWNGENMQKGDGEIWVYITETGTVYHINEACTHLKLSVRAVQTEHADSLRNGSGGRYHPCEVCVEGGERPERVYITDYGDCFHYSLGCNGLKRTIYRVKLKDVEGMPPCSKCSKGDES